MERDDPTPDLRFVVTDDLLNELRSRYDTSVFLYSTDTSEENYEYNMRLRGQGMTVLGLLEWAALVEKTRLAKEFFEAQKPKDGDDAE